MISKAMAWLAKMAIGKKVVVALAWIHDKLDGHRSEINLGVLALVHGLKLAGIIPADTAQTIEASLAAILPVTLADKASKVIKTIDGVVPK